jgi:hypothetical protein
MQRVYAWCQHLDLIATALASGRPVADAVRTGEVDSPLTSPLATRGTTWGPTLDAVLEYDGGCGCFTESRPFAPRPDEAS